MFKLEQRIVTFIPMNSNNPIGIFDSGVGGTSIWKEIHQLLPFENTIYLADSKHAPYGYKTTEEIIKLSIKNTNTLIEMGCKIIVVACNTATTNAISVLRKKYNIPFVGIEPAIKPAALKSKTKNIGILATKGTLSSLLFNQTSEAFKKDLTLVEIVGEGLVPLVEKGALDGPETQQLLQKYMEPMIAANIDYLVLGCSHYPYLIPQLKKILPRHVTILDSGEAVALHTVDLLKRLNLLRTVTDAPEIHFFSNLNTTALEFLLKDHSEYIKIAEKYF